MAGLERPDYGVDAPGVVRNLGIAGVGSLLVAAASWLGFIPRELGFGAASGGGVSIAIAPSLIPAGVSLCAGACWMYFGSKFGKTEERDKLTGRIEWKGDEHVLDVGCGRGLILVGAALRLKTGTAVGVDIWQAEDLSGNRADVPLKNVALEGVAERVTVQTADRWGVAVTFVTRAIGDFRYVGFFKRVRGTRFADLDTLVYSPLCFALGFATARLAWGGD